VFDYLSRVGDLAHGTSMTAAERARLVSGLRGEIDKLRAAEGGAESKAAVRKILARLGRPEEVVSGTGGRTGARTDDGGAAGTARPAFGEAVPAQRESRQDDDRFGEETKPSLWKRAASGRAPRTPPAAPAGPTAAVGASAPHLAGMDELGPEESDPDWWRLDPSPYGDGGGSRAFGEPVPGFVGGIELPELLEPPPGDDEPADGKPAVAKPGGGKAVGGGPTVPLTPAVDVVGKGVERGGAGRLRRLWPVRGAGRVRVSGVVAGPRAGGVVELAAAALLIVGAFVGSLIPLALGWLAAWWSPRLSRTEAKWAAAGMPGVVAAGAVVWLWGRINGRWGEHIAEGGDGLRQVLSDAGPVLLRIAAVASALFLVWRARRIRV